MGWEVAGYKDLGGNFGMQGRRVGKGSTGRGRSFVGMGVGDAWINGRSCEGVGGMGIAGMEWDYGSHKHNAGVAGPADSMKTDQGGHMAVVGSPWGKAALSRQSLQK